MAAGHVATPDSASEHVKLTVTTPLAGTVTTPFTGAGVTVAVIVGGVLSRLTGTVLVTTCPAASVTDPVTLSFAPPVLTVCGGEVTSGGTPPVALQLTVPSELLQP